MKYKNLDLDEEELEIIEAFESGSVKRPKDAEKHLGNLKAAARNYLAEKEKQNFQLEMTRRDRIKLDTMAQEQGVSLEMLISTALHDYVQQQR